MAKLTKKNVLKIPEWRDIGLTNKQIAERLGVHERAITYWVRRLREAGYTVPVHNKGGKTINL